MILYIITPLLILSTLVAVNHLKSNSEVVSKSQNEAIWFVLQLTKEYSEFIYQLQNYQFGKSNHNEMMIQYEILWSRYNTIIDNSMIIHLDHFNGALDKINSHFEMLQLQEPRLLNLPSTHETQALLQRFRADYEELIVFLNYKFRLASGDLEERIRAISEVETVIRYLLLTTLLMGALMAYLLLRESQSHHALAMKDSLTGINNRLWLNQKLRDLEQTNTSFHFYLIDLDGFKRINDTMGHHAGDELLVEVARRLSKLRCKHYCAARMGGDEFAVIELCQPTGNNNSCITEQLTEIFSKPAMFAGSFHSISASIGVSQFPKEAKSVSQVLKQADFAMYEVKQQGKDGLLHYRTLSSLPDNQRVIS
ncbi:GGDEF domain-containing protein [Photobacterium sp. OFAV2-7]|uniref:GGDEF domain-containing protein n=1 Tax=Photobacterium sp. OFAV2-7 TaxID=2917748 RepID=UPI001EF725A8|nr:GGDEF domain-containing protein [Photobacterium sp. OFAV2-7]MCG7585434.1 GGDEF domain-containing protein [Photobacterium sp. OFAV2-7]